MAKSIAHDFDCTHNPCRCSRPVRWREAMSRLGARLGNWNDRRNATGGRRAEHPRRWHAIDRVAMWLYVRPDCGGR